MKKVLVALVGVFSMQVMAMPVIQSDGSSHSVVLVCSLKNYQEAKDLALSQARVKAETICESEVTQLPNPLTYAQCRPNGKEFLMTGLASARYLCGSEDIATEEKQVLKITCTGSCQTTGPGFSCTYHYSDGSTASHSVTICK